MDSDGWLSGRFFFAARATTLWWTTVAFAGMVAWWLWCKWWIGRGREVVGGRKVFILGKLLMTYY